MISMMTWSSSQCHDDVLQMPWWSSLNCELWMQTSVPQTGAALLELTPFLIYWSLVAVQLSAVLLSFNILLQFVERKKIYILSITEEQFFFYFSCTFERLTSWKLLFKLQLAKSFLLLRMRTTRQLEIKLFMEQYTMCITQPKQLDALEK